MRATRRRLGSRSWICAVGGLVCLSLLLLLPSPNATAADGGMSAQAAGDGAVHLVEISGEIDLGLAPYLQRAIAVAEGDDAAAVVLTIDTPGGRLDAVLQMRDALLGAEVPTIAFVDRTAFSAGALIALASTEIHMAPGAVIGAATPVDATGTPADEKVVSAVRSTFRATAVERGRDPLIAEAMVDPAVEIDGLDGRASLLTLTADEALELGYADGLASDTTALLDRLGLAANEIVEHEVSLAERLVRFVTNPVTASLLITIGVWLLIGDLLTGGVGVGAAIGMASLSLFFWGHLLAGLAGWEDVTLLVLGIGLVLIEVFVVPGFGVAGVLGLAALFGGSFLAMLGRDFDVVTGEQIARAATTVGVSFVTIMAGILTTLWYLSRRNGEGRRVILRSRLGATTAMSRRSSTGRLRWFGNGGVLARDRPTEAEARTAVVATPQPSTGSDPATSSSQGRWPAPSERQRHPEIPTGAIGLALSDLRPAGIAEIDGRRIDVVTEGEYIAADEPVEVLRDEGYRRVVRRPRT